MKRQRLPKPAWTTEHATYNEATCTAFVAGLFGLASARTGPLVLDQRDCGHLTFLLGDRTDQASRSQIVQNAVFRIPRGTCTVLVGSALGADRWTVTFNLQAIAHLARLPETAGIAERLRRALGLRQPAVAQPTLP